MAVLRKICHETHCAGQGSGIYTRNPARRFTASGQSLLMGV
jgi:hypothetical protein